MFLQFINKENYKEVMKEIVANHDPIPRIGDSITFDLRERWKVSEVVWNYTFPNSPKVMIIVSQVMDF